MRSPLLLVAAIACSMVACSEFPAGPPVEEFSARRVRASDITVPSGYTIEPIAAGLTFPTGVALDEQGRVYVTEAGYSYGEIWGQARLVRIEADGQVAVVATGSHPPWNGVDYADGAFFVAE